VDYVLLLSSQAEEIIAFFKKKIPFAVEFVFAKAFYLK